MILGLVGKAQSGKDTVADYLVEKHGFVRLAFADVLKDSCAQLFMLAPHQLNSSKGKATVDPRWNVTPRTILQKVGTAAREICPDIWVEHLANRIMTYMHSQPQTNIVITDIRYVNESQMLRDMGGYLLRITRHNEDGSAFQSLVGLEAQHASETEQDMILVQASIVNTTGQIALLLEAVDESLETLCERETRESRDPVLAMKAAINMSKSS